MAGHKYALFFLEESLDDGQEVALADGVKSFEASLADFISDVEAAHWKEWLGTISWDFFVEERRVVSVRVESEHPDVADQDTKQAQLVAQYAATTFMLARGADAAGMRSCLLGRAENGEPRGRVSSIRTHAPYPAVVPPFFVSRPMFRDQRANIASSPSLSDWQGLFASMTGGLPPLLNLAIMSFEEAFTRRRLEFRIPDLIRAADGIIALRKGTGAPQFAEKASRLAPWIAKDPMLGGLPVEPFLLELYQLRSDCVHGKIPFQRLIGQGEEGADQAARFDWAAETLAREALRLAMRHPDRGELWATRESIEDAWSNNVFP